ncbi:MAG: hypothetical protein R2712_16010 [Vicinamibacterales bacterium]
MDRIYRARQGMGGRYVLEQEGTFYWLEGDPFGDYWEGREIGADEKLQWLAPVQPAIVRGDRLGLNYKDHAAEIDKKLPEEPLVFLKPATAVTGGAGRSAFRPGPAASSTRPRWRSSSAGRPPG